MPRVTQIPINAAAGLDFASGAAGAAAQDPDVIMVGEIRDSETVDIGGAAALVGRLFLSTLHTNDATAAVPRLLDMGVEPFLLASTLVLVMAQRLVRRICVACRESGAPTSPGRWPRCARARTSSGAPGVLRADGRPRLRASERSRAERTFRGPRVASSARAAGSAGAWGSSSCSRSTTTRPAADHGAARTARRSAKAAIAAA